jgi:uncharacterized membrane protein
MGLMDISFVSNRNFLRSKEGSNPEDTDYITSCDRKRRNLSHDKKLDRDHKLIIKNLIHPPYGKTLSLPDRGEGQSAKKREEKAMENNQKKKTVMGVDENIEGLLCYVLGWITGIVFLVLEKENKFVRFHAMQSLATFLAFFIILFIVGMIPLIGWFFHMIGWIIMVILWLFLMYKAFKGERYKLPVVGDFAEKQINK